MVAAVDLEITIERRASDDQLTVRMRCEVSPDGMITHSRSVDVQLETSILTEQASNLIPYGQEVSKLLFGDPDQRVFLGAARVAAQFKNVPLRIRLILDPADDVVLNRIRWERIVDLKSGDFLALNSEILLTRLIPGVLPGLTPLDDRPLRALIAIASPDKPADWGLPALDAPAEARALSTSLAPLQCSILEAPVTLERLRDAIAEGFDVVFLMCHGVGGPQEVRLLLDGLQAGEAELVSPRDVANSIITGHPPRLFLVASCSSANHPAAHSNAELPAALAPLLVRRGIPVVVGMSGDVSLETARGFFLRFLARLRDHGDVDVAASEARRSTLRRHDWSAPILFSALKAGDLHWPTGPAEAQPVAFEDWDSLLDSVRDSRCVPVIGTGLLEPAVGKLDQFAAGIASKHAFPLRGHRAENLGQVSRFLETSHGRDGLLNHYGTALRTALFPDGSSTRLTAEDISAWVTSPENPVVKTYGALAATHSPLYLTTDPFDTLADVLRQQGAKPIVEYARWKRGMHMPEPAWMKQDFTISPERPLVYHLFGRWTVPESLILTDDDLLEFLLSAQSGNAILPDQLRHYLRAGDLMFVGFTLEDLEFRAVYRTLLSHMPRDEVRRHIAAQVLPDDNWAKNPDAARDYLASYFNKAAVSIHWGSAADFLEELRARIGANHDA